MGGIVFEKRSLTIGGYESIDVSGLIKLNFLVSAGTGSNCSARNDSGSSGYTNAANMIVRAISLTANAASASNNKLFLFYCDNDLGFGSATVPTNPVGLAGLGITGSVIYIPATAQANPVYHYPDLTVPAGKFLSVGCQSTYTGLVYGQLFCELA